MQPCIEDRRLASGITARCFYRGVDDLAYAIAPSIQFRAAPSGPQWRIAEDTGAAITCASTRLAMIGQTIVPSRRTRPTYVHADPATGHATGQDGHHWLRRNAPYFGNQQFEIYEDHEGNLITRPA